MRAFARLCWLTMECLRAVCVIRNYESRERWLQEICRRTLCVFGAQVTVHGKVPTQGLLVCNHLSYVDVLAVGAVAPATFVAKHEVRTWPFLGRIIRLAGTVFVRRERRMDVARSANEIQAALNRGSLVVLFPEGTSSGGETVLPFKTSLLVTCDRITAGCIAYALPGGNVAEDVCYWRDMTFFPHLFNLLGKEQLFAQLSFAQLEKPGSDRKELGRQLHREVSRLKNSFPVSSSAPARQTVEYARSIDRPQLSQCKPSAARG